MSEAPDWLQHAQNNARKKKNKPRGDGSVANVCELAKSMQDISPSNWRELANLVETRCFQTSCTFDTASSSSPSAGHQNLSHSTQDLAVVPRGSLEAGPLTSTKPDLVPGLAASNFSDNRKVEANDQRQYNQHHRVHHHHYYSGRKASQIDGAPDDEAGRHYSGKSRDTRRTSPSAQGEAGTVPLGNQSLESSYTAYTATFRSIISPFGNLAILAIPTLIVVYSIKYTAEDLVRRGFSGAWSWATGIGSGKWASLWSWWAGPGTGSTSTSGAGEGVCISAVAVGAVATGIWGSVINLFAADKTCSTILHDGQTLPSHSPTASSIQTISPSKIKRPVPNAPILAPSLRELQVRLNIHTTSHSHAVYYLSRFSTCLDGGDGYLDDSVTIFKDFAREEKELHKSIATQLVKESKELARQFDAMVETPASASLSATTMTASWTESWQVWLHQLWVRLNQLLGLRYNSVAAGESGRRMESKGEDEPFVTLHTRLAALLQTVSQSVEYRETLVPALKGLTTTQMAVLALGTCRLAVCVDQAAADVEYRRQKKLHDAKVQTLGKSGRQGRQRGSISGDSMSKDDGAMDSLQMAGVRDYLASLAGIGRMTCAIGESLQPQVKHMLAIVYKDLEVLGTVGEKVSVLQRRVTKMATGKVKKAMEEIGSPADSGKLGSTRAELAREVDGIEEEMRIIMKDLVTIIDGYLEE